MRQAYVPAEDRCDRHTAGVEQREVHDMTKPRMQAIRATTAAALLAATLAAGASAGSLQLPGSSFLPDTLEPPALARGTPDDRIFRAGFEPPVLVERTTTYDTLPEAYMGTSFQHEGVTYREVNMVSGFYPGPENEPFGPGSPGEGGLGNQFIIEDATYLFNDYPEFGSAPNVLNFGDPMFSTPGPNLSLGALASMWMDLDQAADSVRMAIVFYENGPWGGLEIRLDAYLGDELVGSDVREITSIDPEGRDNIAHDQLAIEGVRFDTLHLYSVRQSDGAFTAPRVMVDDLTLGELRYVEEDVVRFDELPEAYMDTSFAHAGISFREVNEVSGFYPGPEGEPFGPGAPMEGGLGNQFIVEDATYLFNDFPEFGSAPNVLNFGDPMFATPGPNLSLGALASTWMDLDEAADGVSMAVVFYENGPWQDIELRLDAYLGDTLVGSDMREITTVDPEGRDNIAHDVLSVQGVRFDTLHLYSVRASDGAFTAPRVMVDDITLVRDYTPSR
jgi:hypothetical protein